MRSTASRYANSDEFSVLNYNDMYINHFENEIIIRIIIIIPCLYQVISQFII